MGMHRPIPGKCVQSLRNRVDRFGLWMARGAASQWIALSICHFCESALSSVRGSPLDVRGRFAVARIPEATTNDETTARQRQEQRQGQRQKQVLGLRRRMTTKK